MEVPLESVDEDVVKKPQESAPLKKCITDSVGSAKKMLKNGKPSPTQPIRPSGPVLLTKKRAEGTSSLSDSGSSTKLRASVSGSPSSASDKNVAALKRRNSVGGLTTERQSVNKRPENITTAAGLKRVSSSVSETEKQNPTESRRASLTSLTTKPSTPSSVSSTMKTSRLSPRTDNRKQEIVRKPLVKPSILSPQGAFNSSPGAAFGSSVKKGSTPLSVTQVRSSVSLDGSASSLKRMPSTPSSRSPSINSKAKLGSLSASVDRGSSSVTGRRKSSTPDGRDSRFVMLPQVEIKAGDDVRLDLRGHRVRNLDAGGLNLSPNLEFVYLRDNLLSSLTGIEILKRVKVLDLSFNEFKGPGFEPLENCKALQQLYLAGNQITSLASLPQLPNLEFLSVAQNKLKSLAMASQPRLQVLAASKNKISTLKGFPHLPLLEHLRVEENPILEMPHLEAASILLVGPTLKKFNDRDLSSEEQKLAKLYPAHTALCIRDGWDFCKPELSEDSTFRFFYGRWKDHLPPGYILKEACVDQPFEDDACRCHFVFVKDRTVSNDSELFLKYQWFIGEKTPTGFVAIKGANGESYWPKHEEIDRFLKVECIPILGDTEYPPIFAVSCPVTAGTGCPKVLNLKVEGELVEGNVIKGFAEVAWCGGPPGKGVASWLRRRWNSSPVVIVGAEDEEYRLTVDDIDSSLVFMYTPVTEEGVKGEPQYAMTDFVKAATPSVSNVRILHDAVEGITIKGVGDYFGGREGPSKFEWLRENKETGEFTVVLTGTSEYTLTKEDIGVRLGFVYIPINFEGQEGKPVTAMTDTVKQAPPKVSNLKIVGDIREGSKVSVSASVTGGTEGSSRVQWFKTSSSKLDGENSLEAVSTSKIAKAFRIPLGAVGYYIVAKFIPMAPDGDSGEPAYVISDKAVETLPPSLNFLSVTGDYSEGEILTASYGYIGGHEGDSQYNWYLHESENDPGILIPEASGLLQYRISKEAIGNFVSFRCTPARDDGTIGEPRTLMGQERVRPGSPRLLSLQILGECVEGSTLHVDKRYWGGSEGGSVFRWFLTSSDATQHEIKGASSSSYTISSADIGFHICVSCEPIRSDWARGPTVLSQDIGPILPGSPTCELLEFRGSMVEGQRLSFAATYWGGEKGDCIYEWFRLRSNNFKDKLSSREFLELTNEDVGRCIQLVFTPVRKDRLRGDPKIILSDVIAPADPVALELGIPDGYEDEEMVPRKSYYGGQEGDGKYTWFRLNQKIPESELMSIADACANAGILGNNLTYSPKLEDVGAYLALRWVPVREDGKCGAPIVAISDGPVAPALPTVRNVQIKELSSGVFSGVGDYYGGFEGSSLFSWYREIIEGTMSLINGANSITYKVTDEDYNCRLFFGYTPVRSDSVVGELRLSEPSDIVLPELPQIQKLIFNGKAVEGEVLTAIEVIPDSEAQQHVWDKYKKEVKYQWSYSSEMGDSQSFEQLPSQRSCSYKVRLEDINRSLRCECIVTDVFGRSSEPASAVTGPVTPGIPKIDKLEIEGRGFHTNLYAVRGIYSGGKEGKSRIQWLRSMVGSPDLISIPGEVSRMYEANVDDVGYRLVAVYTPVREDGVEGQPVSASTEPITVEPDVFKEVKQKLELGAVKFEALRDRDRSPKTQVQQGVIGGLERRLLEVNRKRVKVVKPGSKTSFPATEIRGTYAPPFHVEVFRNDQHRLKIVVDSENEVDLMVQTRHMRDVIVLVIRGLAQRFNSTSLNSLLKIEP
ncbi:hypothetical protein AMTRI_Chr02g212440 [Amborella trichopoda]